MLYVLSLVVSFIAVFLKGFQHKNVIGMHYRAVFVTSWAMAAFDVAAVTIIVKGGWWIALTAGTGASFGMVCAMYVHAKLFKEDN